MAVSFEQLKQQYISLREAPKYFPGRPHINSIRRWANDGVNGRRLKTWKLGGRIFTTQEAIEEFMEPQFEESQPAGKTPRHAAAEAKLDAMGVK